MSDLTYCLYTEKITSAGIIVPMLACCHSNDDSYKDTVHLTGQQYEKLAATVMDRIAGQSLVLGARSHGAQPEAKRAHLMSGTGAGSAAARRGRS